MVRGKGCETVYLDHLFPGFILLSDFIFNQFKLSKLKIEIMHLPAGVLAWANNIIAAIKNKNNVRMKSDRKNITIL